VLISNLSEKKPPHYLMVKLRGTTSNRDGLGAIVKVTAGGTTYTKVLDGNTGYLSHGVYPLYFGLGSAATVDSVEVIWPSGKTQKTGPVKVNGLLTLPEQ
jgi:enediyne biosynthesis protein E4